jgi:hypothetical protein
MPDLNSWKNVVLLQGEGHESHDSERSNQASLFSDLEVLPNLRMHQRRRFRGDQSTRVQSPRLATRLGCANKLIDLIAEIGLFRAHCTEIVKVPQCGVKKKGQQLVRFTGRSIYFFFPLHLLMN